MERSLRIFQGKKEWRFRKPSKMKCNRGKKRTILVEYLVLTMCMEDLEILKMLNIVGVILVIAFIAALASLMREIIDWLIALSPPQRDHRYEAINYGYSNNGPSEWKKRFSACNGQMQSPINIDIKSSTCIENFEPLQWINYDQIPVTMFMSNLGNTVSLSGRWSNGKEPILTGGALGIMQYIFKKAVFRWGDCPEEGSEHTINFERYPLEMQLEHFNRDNPDDLACVSYFYQISVNDNRSLGDIVNRLGEITSPGLSASICPQPLNRLAYTFSHGYYSYCGSLTYPPCTENVTWIIFPDPFCVSLRQIELLRGLVGEDGCPVISNSRPVQFTNDRVIYYYNHVYLERFPSC